MEIVKYIICIVSFLFGSSLFGQKLITIDDSTTEIICIGEYLEILEDTSSTWTINDISSPAFENKFVVNLSDYPYNENINSTYWVKFRIANHTKSGKGFLIESYAPHTNDWQFYYPDDNEYKVKKSGLDINFYSREYINKNLILDLPIKSGEELTFFVKVTSKNHSSFDFRIKPQRDFFFYSVNEYYFLGIFYGILLIMAVYNLLMYFSVWEKIYLYYVAYVICGMLTTLADDGLGYQFIWVHYPEVNSFIGPHIAPILLLVFFTLYSRAFLDLKKSLPEYDKIILWLVGMYLVYYVLKITILPLAYHTHFFYLLPLTAIYFASIISLYKGMRAARYFVMGFSFVLISIVIIKLRSNGTVEGNLFTVYSLNYGLVLEVLVLSFAMAERFRYAKKERERALKERNSAQYRALRQFRRNEELKEKVNLTLKEKNDAQQRMITQLSINEELKDKINKELEKKVQERTQELNLKNNELIEANFKLQEMTNIANQMSIKLDLDNWNLQKKVEESIQARMKGVVVSEHEFAKLFPDDSACNRYLNELKWGKTYHCRKCNYSESIDDMDGGGKKCVKCGYYESVTAHTLFHGIKFPIQKAFLITYIKVHKKEKLTMDMLSEMVDLRRNTCWKFNHKIDLETEEYLKKSKNKKLFSWEDIIYPNH